ncbi:MAG: YfhL family 4Fe-4S dicluster ferredoxin [Ignavibacteriaceae bacterium]
MALMITSECIVCGACEPECPSNAITAGEAFYEIGSELCAECVGYYYEPQCRSICPVDEAVIVNPKYRETKGELIKKKLLMDMN